METREPVVADQFYEAGEDACLSHIRQCLPKGLIKADLPENIVGGIVPHAGWVFSGDLAALVFSAVKQVHDKVDTFVIFGAVHRDCGSSAMVYGGGLWKSPIGEIAVDQELASEIAGISCATNDSDSHRYEHSIEVQVPFIQYLFEDARIVPVMVAPSVSAVEFGEKVGNILTKVTDKKVVCIASTDLTHYGPRYGFCPMGRGAKGLRWAKEVNDAEFIDFALKMEPKKLLKAGVENSSACGPGAAAALVAAVQKLGKTNGVLLGHTDSNEIMMAKYNSSSEESVGYAAIVY